MQCAGTGATRLAIGLESGGPLGLGSRPMRDYGSTWRRDGEGGEPWMITKEDTWAYVMCQGLGRVGLSWLSRLLCCRVYSHSH